MTNGVTIMADRHRNEGQGGCELKSLLVSFLLWSFLQETSDEEQEDCVFLLSLCVLGQQELWLLQDAAEAHPEKPVNVAIMDTKTASATILKGIPYISPYNIVYLQLSSGLNRWLLNPHHKGSFNPSFMSMQKGFPRLFYVIRKAWLAVGAD